MQLFALIDSSGPSRGLDFRALLHTSTAYESVELPQMQMQNTLWESSILAVARKAWSADYRSPEEQAAGSTNVRLSMASAACESQC